MMTKSTLPIAILLALSGTPYGSAQVVETIALSGTHAPGTPEGTLFDVIRRPVLNNAGDVAFRGSLVGPNVQGSNRQGIWTGNSENLNLIAREGEQAPGTEANTLFSGLLNAPTFNDRGKVLFKAFVTGPGVSSTNDIGLWSTASGPLSLIVRNGDIAPGGLPTDQFTNLFSGGKDIELTNSGVVAFSAVATPQGLSRWIASEGSLTALVRRGDTSPGVPGAVFQVFASSRETTNNAGDSIFPGVAVKSDGTRVGGIWFGTPGALHPVALEGDTVPGSSDSFRILSSPALNDAGQFAFRAYLQNSQISGIWKGGTNGISLVAKSRGHAPGVVENLRFSFDIFHHPRINNSGDVAFKANLQAGNTTLESEESIWSTLNGNLRLLAREGDPAPGIPNEGLFGSFGSPPIVINDVGQVAFYSPIRGDGLSRDEDAGIWASEQDGTLRLVVREGDLLEVAPGDIRTVRWLHFNGANGSSPTDYNAFNNRGELAFLAGFTDGSRGLFISRVVAVPEPNTLLLFSMASTSWFLGRRRCVS